jgi:flagellar biogenesis protein FliO
MDAVRTPLSSTRLAALVTQSISSVCSLARKITIRRRESSLQICETLSLGEKRLVLVVQYEKQRFLIGATNQSVSLLHQLEDKPASIMASGGTSLDVSGRE